MRALYIMISILRRGQYRLIETAKQTKILLLDNLDSFAWISAGEIGQILVESHKTQQGDCVLAIGNYRLYNARNEKYFSDQQHLELYVGDGIWQGYLLPTGLPTDVKKRNRIIPTKEIITKVMVGEYFGSAWL